MAESKQISRPLLVLDLDETLVFADEEPLSRAWDHEISPYYIYKRPGLDSFLISVFKHYEVGVWTSSSPAYASAVTRAIFRDVKALSFTWASDRCTRTRDFEADKWTQAKRLRKLRRLGYDLTQVVVVDDSPEKHTKNYGNLVRVEPFLGSLHDTELASLSRYLTWLAPVPNFRHVEKRTWRSHVSVVGEQSAT